MEDLSALLDHFIRLYNRQLGKQVRTASADVVDMLAEYSWPGNVRELQSAVKYALVHARGNVVTPECFPDSCRSSTSTQAVAHPSCESQEHENDKPKSYRPTGGLEIGQRFAQLLDQRHPDAYHAIENEVDRYLLTEALHLAHGNQVEASRLLGISRTTLRAKLDAFGISIEKQVQVKPVHHDQGLDSSK